MAEPLLVALGGNALLAPGVPASLEGEREALGEALDALCALARDGRPLLVTHGNGPQVGHALTRSEAARGLAYPLPIDVCVAQTQAEIGYLVAQGLDAALARAGIARGVVCLLTRTLVAPGDGEATKPIGPWLPHPPAEGEATRDERLGWRRCVASPRPIRILETEAIRVLLRAGTIVIAAGGGGVAVRAASPGATEGVAGIVDKDHASAVLALALSIPRILDLTNVEHVQLDHGTPRARDLRSLTVAEARSRLSQGHFGEGTMRPKIEAAIRFLEGGGETFDVTTPARALEALEGRVGTRLRR